MLRRIVRAALYVLYPFAVYFFAVGFSLRCASVPSLRQAGAACVVSFARNVEGETVALYERAEILAEANADEWWMRTASEPRAVNIPKARVLRFGEIRRIGLKVCRCPEAR